MRVPKLGHHKGTGQARVTINGTDHYLGKFGSPEAEERYKQLVANLVTSNGAPPVMPGNTLTIREVVARWSVEKPYPVGSQEPMHVRYALQPLLDLFGSEPASELRPKKLKAVQAEMVRRDWCRNVVNHNINRIRTVWRWAESEELVPPGSSHTLDTVKALPKNYPGVRNTEDVKPSTREDLDKTLAVLRIRSPRAAVMLEVQWLIGMRSCEVRILRACDIDRSSDVWFYRPIHAKTDHIDGHAARAVPLGPACQKILEPFFRDAKPEAYLFPSRRRDHYSADGYSLVVRAAAKKAGVKLTAYAGRHAAKKRIAAAMGLDAARAVLGHSSLETTNKYSHHQDLELAAEVARKLA